MVVVWRGLFWCFVGLLLVCFAAWFCGFGFVLFGFECFGLQIVLICLLLFCLYWFYSRLLGWVWCFVWFGRGLV